jgi:hypothetical protein
MTSVREPGSCRGALARPSALPLATLDSEMIAGAKALGVHVVGTD